MALPDLSKMKDEDYKLLTSEQLMMYNKDLPKMDYERPYFYQPYPKHIYKPATDADGVQRLQAVICNNAKELERFVREGWAESPMAFGVITAPSAPEIKNTGFAFEMPMPKVETKKEVAAK